MNNTTAEQITKIFSKGGVLIIGEGITTLSSTKISHNKSDTRSSLLENIQTNLLQELSKCNWQVVLSLCRDINFEEHLRTFYDSIATSRRIAILDRPKHHLVPERSIPVYKLLGSIADEKGSSIVYKEADYTRRRAKWHKILADVKDHIRDLPIFITGISDQKSVFIDLLSEIMELLPHGGASKNLLISEEDVIYNDPTIADLTENFHLLTVSSTRLAIVQSLAKIESIIPGSSLTALGMDIYNNLITVVPNPKDSPDICDDRNLILRDQLCMPALLNWDPFKAEIDWIRTYSTQIVTEVKTGLESLLFQPQVIELTGDVGTGKTTILKRAAYDLASNGISTFWIKHDSLGTIEDLRSFLKLFGKTKKGIDSKLVLFIDSPNTGEIKLSEYLSELESSNNSWSIVYSLRATDSLVNNSNIDVKPNQRIEIPTQLGNEELQDLKTYLVKQGYPVNDEILSKLDAHSAKDVLCLFWYFNPETQGTLSDAIKQEYFTLDSPESAVRYFTDKLKSSELRKVYQLVAVASLYDLALPQEVLVNASGYSFDEWGTIIATKDHPIWSLIYEDQIYFSEEERFISIYLSRNAVVTKVVVNLINGGGLGHTGEYSILMDMIASCDGSSPIYGSFICRLLIDRAQKLKGLADEQYHDLWKQAKKTYPHWDKALQHHYGLFIRNTVNDFSLAYKTIAAAHNQPDNPTTKRLESYQNIETSLAATWLRAYESGESTISETFQKVEKHIENARRKGAFNAHSSHVQAVNYFKLAQKIGDRETNQYLKSLNRSLVIIDEAKSLTGEHDKHNFTSLETDVVSELSVALTDQTDDFGDFYYKSHSSQMGYVAVATKLLHDAIESQKGRHFGKVLDYLNAAFRIINENEDDICSELKRLLVDLYIKWYYDQRRGSVPWEIIKNNITSIVSQNKKTENTYLLFYLAIANYHLGKVNDGNFILNDIGRSGKFARSAYNKIRQLMRDNEGNGRTYTGNVVSKGTKYPYIECAELKSSFKTDSHWKERVDGSSVIFKVGFRLDSAIALPKDFLLREYQQRFR